MSSSKPTILIIGTLDTKLSELLYLREQILGASNGACQTRILDVGRSGRDVSAMVPGDEVIVPLRGMAEELVAMERTDYVSRTITMCTPVLRELVARSSIHGVVSAGGSCGSSIATTLMRNACPIGFPKLMVSTMASGDIKPYIEETDITMMYSVVDIAGINSILRQILSNAAGAIVGMSSAYVLQRKAGDGETSAVGRRIALTMFGVTTPCADLIREMLTITPQAVSGYEIYVFHATGAGGRAMERLIEEGQIDAVIDLTTTEIADEVVGGVLSAGPRRLEAAAERGIPTVISVGACDMVNFGPKDTVPPKFADRNLYIHNPAVTLMRTTPSENEKIGSFISSKLKTHASDPSKIRVLLPKKGLSLLGVEGQPYHDPKADAALFTALKSGLLGSDIEIIEHDEAINTEAFAKAVCESLLEMLEVDPRSYRLSNARRRQWSFDHGKSIHAARRASFVSVPDAD